MKKLVFTAIVMAGLSASAYAQGTVAFQNYTTGSVLGEVFSNNVFTPFIGAVNLELFWGPLGDTAAQLLALNTGLVYSTVIPTPAAGHFSDSTVAITSATAGTGSGDVNSIELLLTAWIGTGANYNAALLDPVNNAGFGRTLPFANPTGGGGSPAAAPANMVGWTAANPLFVDPGPEPSTIMLGALGATALLLFRRHR